MPPKSRNRQEEEDTTQQSITAYNKPQEEWAAYREWLHGQPACRGDQHKMNAFETTFSIDLDKELSQRKFARHLPVELLKLDAVVVTKVDWYPDADLFALLTPPIFARQRLIRTFVTPMCDLFTKLHNAGEHEDLQILLLAAMASLAHKDCDNSALEVLLGTAMTILLNVDSEGLYVVEGAVMLMCQLCSTSVRECVLRFVGEHQAMFLASFKLKASSRATGEQQALDQFSIFLRTVAMSSLDVKARIPREDLPQLFPLVATSLEISSDAEKACTLQFIANTISEERFYCWLSLPHLKRTIQKALDFDQWDLECLDSDLIVNALCTLRRFINRAPSEKQALAAAHELSNGRLLELFEIALQLSSSEGIVFFAQYVLSQLVGMKSFSHTRVVPSLFVSIENHPLDSGAIQLINHRLVACEGVEYVLSCGYLSVIARCLRDCCNRVCQVPFALEFLEYVFGTFNHEYAGEAIRNEEQDDVESQYISLDPLVMPCQFPIILFLKEQHPQVVDGLKHVVEEFWIPDEVESARRLLDEIGDIV